MESFTGAYLQLTGNGTEHCLPNISDPSACPGGPLAFILQSQVLHPFHTHSQV